MYNSHMNAPAVHWVSVTPSDATILPAGCRGLWVGGTGNIALQSSAGTTVTFTNVANGTMLSVSPSKVMSTNTTATAIIALY